MSYFQSGIVYKKVSYLQLEKSMIADIRDEQAKKILLKFCDENTQNLRLHEVACRLSATSLINLKIKARQYTFNWNLLYLCGTVVLTSQPEGGL